MLALGDCVASEVVFGDVRANHGRNTSSSGCHVPSSHLFAEPSTRLSARNGFVPMLKPMPTTGSPVSRIGVQPYCGAVGVIHGLTQLFTNGSSPHSATSWLSAWMSAMYGAENRPGVE